jgi:hypothetical protein
MTVSGVIHLTSRLLLQGYVRSLYRMIRGRQTKKKIDFLPSDGGARHLQCRRPGDRDAEFADRKGPSLQCLKLGRSVTLFRNLIGRGTLPCSPITERLMYRTRDV